MSGNGRESRHSRRLGEMFSQTMFSDLSPLLNGTSGAELFSMPVRSG